MDGKFSFQPRALAKYGCFTQPEVLLRDFSKIAEAVLVRDSMQVVEVVPHDPRMEDIDA